jgi:hypothetical protein
MAGTLALRCIRSAGEAFMRQPYAKQYERIIGEI